MPSPPPSPPTRELSEFVEAFEAGHARGNASLSDYLPPPGYPLRGRVLCELIRVDMEFAWDRGRPKDLDAYATEFPEIRAHPQLFAEVAFEEFRLRAQAGQEPSPQEYAERYGLDVSTWIGLSAQDLRQSEAPEAEGQPASNNATDVVGDVFDNVGSLKPPAAEEKPPAAQPFPDVGTDFLGFRLVGELGRGSFARVYLARQAGLADRLVVLKVAADIFGESQTLAQLQHTNIVPVYSCHRSGGHQAVCMPYFGATTLAHLIDGFGPDGKALPTSGRHIIDTLQSRRGSTATGAPSSEPSAGSVVAPPAEAPALPAEAPAAHSALTALGRLSYVESVLWLTARLADGLAHAHERGILHRDLKPANVLVADDGQPMLLDFNLSVDTKLPAGAPTRNGGTLPYMSPEQLETFATPTRAIDGRSDLYSLGVILYELLTGRHPFPVHLGTVRERIPRLLADRAKPPAPGRIRALNPAVSPAVESIALTLLAPDPAKRYPSARHLQEDIQRHLRHQPLKFAPEPSTRERLRKWVRRHPRLSSATSVAAAAAVVLAAAGTVVAARGERLRVLHARAVYGDFLDQGKTTKFALYRRTLDRDDLEESIRLCRDNLARYGLPGDADWQQRPEVRKLSDDDKARLREEVGEHLFLLARALSLRAADHLAGEQRGRELLAARDLNDLAEREAGERFPWAIRAQRAHIEELLGHTEVAGRLASEARGKPVRSARDAFLVGHEYARAGDYRSALPYLKQSTALEPDSFPAWFVRGNCHQELGQFESAAGCFSVCVALRPESHQAWHQRGLMHYHLRWFRDARGDFDRAIELEPPFTDAHIDRALARQAEGDFRGAIADLTRVLELDGHPVRVYFTRAWVRERAGDRAGAAADREEGLRHRPTDVLSWVARAEARLAADPQTALADVEEALKLHPRSVAALQLKAHLLDRLGHGDDALRVLDRAVAYHPDHVPFRGGRGVALARAGKRDLALADAREALVRDTAPSNLYQVACIYALTARTNPDDRLEAFELLRKALRAGFGFDLVDTDTDLDPIRGRPEFARIVQEARALHGNGAAPRKGPG